MNYQYKRNELVYCISRGEVSDYDVFPIAGNVYKVYRVIDGEWFQLTGVMDDNKRGYGIRELEAIGFMTMHFIPYKLLNATSLEREIFDLETMGYRS